MHALDIFRRYFKREKIYTVKSHINRTIKGFIFFHQNQLTFNKTNSLYPTLKKSTKSMKSWTSSRTFLPIDVQHLVIILWLVRVILAQDHMIS